MWGNGGLYDGMLTWNCSLIKLKQSNISCFHHSPLLYFYILGRLWNAIPLHPVSFDGVELCFVYSGAGQVVRNLTWWYKI